MTNRFFGVLYVLAAAWGLFVASMVNLNNNGAGIVLFVAGLGPLLAIGVVHYILFGRL